MRRHLHALAGQRLRFVGIFARFGTKNGYRGPAIPSMDQCGLDAPWWQSQPYLDAAVAASEQIESLKTEGQAFAGLVDYARVPCGYLTTDLLGALSPTSLNTRRGRGVHA